MSVYYYYYSYTENAVLHITLVNGKWTVHLQQKLKQAGVWTTVYNMYNIYDVYNMKHGNSDKRVMNDSWHVPVMTQRYHEDWRWPRSITLRWLHKEVILLWQNDVVLRGDKERQNNNNVSIHTQHVPPEGISKCTNILFIQNRNLTAATLSAKNTKVAVK